MQQDYINCLYNKVKNTGYIRKKKKKITSFSWAAFSNSDMQPPIEMSFPWPLCYIRKLAFRFPQGNYFTLSFVCSQHTTLRNIKFAQTPPSQGTNSHLCRMWSLGDSFLVPREIHISPVQDSNQGPLHLQANVLPLNQCTLISIFNLSQFFNFKMTNKINGNMHYKFLILVYNTNLFQFDCVESFQVIQKHSRIRSWNQPVLSNQCKVSCSRKQWLAPDWV